MSFSRSDEVCDKHPRKYRFQFGQRLTEPDMLSRSMYCGTFLAIVYVDSDFLRYVWLSDESHIHLDGYINRQTTSFLYFDLPNFNVQKPLRSARVTIWCAFLTRSLLRPYLIQPRSLQEHGYQTISAEFEKVLSCKGPPH